MSVRCRWLAARLTLLVELATKLSYQSKLTKSWLVAMVNSFMPVSWLMSWHLGMSKTRLSMASRLKVQDFKVNLLLATVIPR